MQIQTSEKLRAAIDALNACGQSYDRSGAITFKPKIGTEASAREIILEGLAEFGMNPAPLGNFRLSAKAIDVLKPHGLVTVKAYELERFKNEGIPNAIR